MIYYKASNDVSSLWFCRADGKFEKTMLKISKITAYRTEESMNKTMKEKTDVKTSTDAKISTETIEIGRASCRERV